MSPASASLFDVVAITAVAVVLAVVLLVVLMRRAAAHAYRALDFLLSPAEAELLATLRQGLGADYEVYPKVRLADLIDVRKGLTRKQRADALAHIESRHVALVVCDRETNAIRGVVEPELATARRPGRHRQVPFLDAALAAAQVPLVRVPAQSPHSPDELRDRVLAALGPAVGGRPAEPVKLGYFGPATDALRADVGGRVANRGRERDDGPGSAATWLPTRGVLAVAAVLLILGAVLSWLVERPAPGPRPTQPAASTAPPPPSAGPTPAPAAPAAEVAPVPEKPREIVGYRDVRVPGKPLAECMGPDREIGPEVLRCRDGYTRREPIYR